MITKINKIKNLGLFSNYRWNGQLPLFKRYNVIYGWNGSGKTTLSRLFAALESGKHENYNNLQYEVDFEGTVFSQGQPCNQRIRVFNLDYVKNNIDMIEGKANSIFILGEKDKALAEEIKKLELQLHGAPDNLDDFGLLKNLEAKKRYLATKKSEKNGIFTNVARSISSIGVGRTTRSYVRGNAENDFYNLTNKSTLSDEELATQNTIINSEEKDEIPEIVFKQTEELFGELLNEARQLLKSTVKVRVIEELTNNFELSQWIEQGLSFHNHEGPVICKFCGQEVPEARIVDLTQFFNKEDQRLKKELDELIGKFYKFINEIETLAPSDEARLFPEARLSYSECLNSFLQVKNETINGISNLIGELSNKKNHTTESLTTKSSIELLPLLNAISRLNEKIKDHNTKSKNFSKHVNEAREKVKTHYLSEVFDEVKLLDEEINQTVKEIFLLENGDSNVSPELIGINKIQEIIRDNKNKISAAGLACDEFNKNLETFLGRKELTFETTDEGYLLKRNGVLADNLSEGEKTAIAFIYFTIHLRDIEFVNNKGVVVIDDPISSLDSNSLFQAFSFLKNAVRDCTQVFILTHNFDFLQMIIKWYKSLNRFGEKVSYFMIINKIESGDRIADIDRLDNLLIDYDTEYQYLFKRLLGCNLENNTIEGFYLIPNIARKVLEYFLMIMVPDSKDIYSKLETITFDDNKKTAIYNFVNDQSHMTGKDFDPSLVPEAKKVIPYLFEMMETTFPEHYKILTENCK